MNRQDFQSLALERLEDAQTLLHAGRYSGAYYIAGYAVECALKACIARQTNQDDFPPKNAREYYVHDIEDLLGHANLETEHKAQSASDPAFEASWTVVKDWNEEARYQPATQQAAEGIISAISDPQHGVLPWLRRYW